MFFETSYNNRLGDTASEKAIKAAIEAAGPECFQRWKQAGRPQNPNFCAIAGPVTGGGYQPAPNQPVTTLPGPAAGGGSPAAGGAAPSAGENGGGLFDGVGDFFSSIPREYLMIGGVIILIMIFKKR